jgi:hypothetical protein
MSSADCRAYSGFRRRNSERSCHRYRSQLNPELAVTAQDSLDVRASPRRQILEITCDPVRGAVGGLVGSRGGGISAPRSRGCCRKNGDAARHCTCCWTTCPAPASWPVGLGRCGWTTGRISCATAARWRRRGVEARWRASASVTGRGAPRSIIVVSLTIRNRTRRWCRPCRISTTQSIHRCGVRAASTYLR